MSGGAAAAGPRRRVDLHIGTEKTGTSTIQAVMQANTALLEEHGVCYPSAPGRGNHVGLAIVGRGDDVVDDLRRSQDLTTPELVRSYRVATSQALTREVEESAADRVLLSSEHCSSRLSSVEDVRRLVDWLGDTLEADLHVHVYLRRQDRMLESRHSTAVRAGAAVELELPDDRTLRSLYDYRALLDRWAQVVGEDRVHPRRFDRARLVDGDVVSDICHVLDLPTLAVPAGAFENTALDAATQRFAAIANQYIPRFDDDGRNPLHRRLVRALDTLEPAGPPEQLSTADAAVLLDSVRAGNDEVARRWFDGPPLFDEERRDRGPVRELDVEGAVAIAAHVASSIVAQMRDERAAAESAVSRRLGGRIASLERELADVEQQLRAARTAADELRTRPAHRVGRLLVDPVRTIRGRLRRLSRDG